MKIQIDIPYEINKKIKHYKIDNDFQTQVECIIDILIKYFNLDACEGKEDGR